MHLKILARSRLTAGSSSEHHQAGPVMGGGGKLEVGEMVNVGNIGITPRIRQGLIWSRRIGRCSGQAHRARQTVEHLQGVDPRTTEETGQSRRSLCRANTLEMGCS